MPEHDRDWLLAHLNDQARGLAALADSAHRHPADLDQLVAVRDQVFVMRETLDTLGVAHALVSNADWNRAIGTTRS
jgi:hypothetical protein